MILVKTKLRVCFSVVVLASALCFLYPGISFSQEPMSDEDFVALCKSGSAAEISAALDGGADANTIYKGKYGSQWSALMMASAYNGPDAVEVLIDRGAGINLNKIVGNPNYGTPLVAAAFYNNNPLTVQKLIDKGAVVNDESHGTGATPLRLCMDRVETDIEDIVTVLVQNGADLEIRDNNGYTILFSAVRMKPVPRVLKRLIELGADLKALDKEGRNIFQFALSEQSSAEVLSFFIDAGVDASGGKSAIKLNESLLKKMSVFVSNFTEVGLFSFDVAEAHFAHNYSEALSLKYEDYVHFGIMHTYLNNKKSVKKRDALMAVGKDLIDQAVFKYFGWEFTDEEEYCEEHGLESIDYNRYEKSNYTYNPSREEFVFSPPEEQEIYYARVTRAYNSENEYDGDFVCMTGTLYNSKNTKEEKGFFVAYVTPVKRNGTDTWAMMGFDALAFSKKNRTTD